MLRRHSEIFRTVLLLADALLVIASWLGAYALRADDGEIVLKLPFPQESGLNLEKFNPTAITVAPNGDIFLADGYASNHIFKFDKAGKYLKHFGEKGNDLRQFNTWNPFAKWNRAVKTPA